MISFVIRMSTGSGAEDRRLRPSSRPRCSGDLDLDLLRLGLRGPAQVDGQHAVFKLSADLRGAGIIRERKVAHETAVGPFDTVIPLAFLFLLELAFARN